MLFWGLNTVALKVAGLVLFPFLLLRNQWPTPKAGQVASLGRSDPVWSGGPPFLSRPRIGTNLRYQRRLDPWTGPAHHGTDGRSLPGRADDQLAAGSGYFYWGFLGSPLLFCGETPVWVDTPAEICGCWEPWPPRPPALSISKKRPTPWTPNR